MKTILYLSFSLPVLGLLFSCKKETVKNPPVIEVISPVENAAYPLSNAVEIHAKITHERELHDIRVTVERVSDGALVYEQSGHNHSTGVEIQGNWQPDALSAPANYRAVFFADDHEGFETADTVHFSTQ